MKVYYKNSLKGQSRYLRNNSTLSEVLLWNEIKGKKMNGYQFMRQKPIDNYIADFYCSRLKLIIEIDGESHIKKEQKDRFRQDKLQKLGFNFIRFSDLDVKKNLNGVIISLISKIDELEKGTTP